MEKYAEAFARRVAQENLPVEAMAIYQDDKLVAELRFVPDAPRNIYSHTKSYMATAVGIAMADGALSLDDRPADFFREALPLEGADALRGITLRHLLTMSSGFDEALLMMGERGKGIGAPDYAKYLFSQPLKKTPGEKFCYSNGDSYLAGRMVEARVGMTLRDYLNERLFAPLEIPYPEWEHCPMGHTFGASGMKLALLDMMKLGRLYLSGGVWKGRRLVEESFIAMATARQIETPGAPDHPWHVGYGFQFWLSPYPRSYRADGAYGQITTVLPEKNVVLGVQCTESDRSRDVIRALDEEVFSRL